MQDIPQRKSVGKSKPRLADRDADGEYMTALPDQPSTSKMNFHENVIDKTKNERIASDDFPLEIKQHFHTDHEVLLYHNRCTCPMLNFSYVLRACSLKLDRYRHNSHYLLAWWVSSRH
ncbi:hypothetical protein NC653_029464 [Populus alba x Populus x berolinensis]|uniref:Uncharacterized protein n=1 Tax=Populus alba x Populus x berolinensis TaxID=444605 RepID=A0AAD6Q3D7_9ROSI|nr:hypothetical protein NC653_029464 [Populus alba x Populus x berolinensis]